MSTALATDVDPRALREAAGWFARLQSGEVSEDEHHEWAHWCAADPVNAQAWARVESVRAQLMRVPGRIAAPALLQRERMGRRTVLRSFAGVGAIGLSATVSYRLLPWEVWTADARSSVGERRDLVLDDGSRLWIDTASAVDIRYDDSARRLLLREGAVFIQTAADTARPFIVETPHGQLRALGTRFGVRLESDSTVLSVLEHAVEIRPKHALDIAHRVQAGTQLRFNGDGVLASTSVPASASSWIDGSLIVVDMPLGNLVAELARYRAGVLRCDPQVAELKVSGAFPLDDIDRALAALTRGFPVELRRRGGGWLTGNAITVVARR